MKKNFKKSCRRYIEYPVYLEGQIKMVTAQKKNLWAKMQKSRHKTNALLEKMTEGISFMEGQNGFSDCKNEIEMGKEEYQGVAKEVARDNGDKLRKLKKCLQSLKSLQKKVKALLPLWKLKLRSAWEKEKEAYGFCED